MRLAIERGELMGRGGSSYASLAAETPTWLSEHKIDILVQFGRQKEPELPDVPLLGELAGSDEARQIAAIVSAPSAMGYGYWVAPEVPAVRADVLRAAFEASVQDEGLRKEAAMLGLRPAPQSAAATAASVRALAATPQNIRDRIVAILGWRN
jgi:tripartite-type tricarboxylate transporter receptor subunit TctC